MKSLRFQLLIISFFTYSVSFGQKLKKADRTIVANIQSHIKYLGNSRLGGRVAGTAGDSIANEYIIKQFERAGIRPIDNEHSWLQRFNIYDGKEILPASRFSINNQELILFRDYFPFAFSADKETEGSAVMALSEKGVPWFTDLKDLIEDSEENSKKDTIGLISAKATRAAARGATALVIYNTTGNNDLLYDGKSLTKKAQIPVLYITKKAASKYLSDESASLDIKLNIELKDKLRVGSNVIGYVDNGADSSIITSAHLDDEKKVAALLEMARLLKGSRNRSSNYLFIVFSGENHGQVGSDYFNAHPFASLQRVNHIIRLDTEDNATDEPLGLVTVKRCLATIENTNTEKKK